MSKVELGFVPEPRMVAVDRILPSRKAPVGLVTSRKYKQIQASIAEVGLIEPLTISHLIQQGFKSRWQLGTAAGRRHGCRVAGVTHCHSAVRTLAKLRPVSSRNWCTLTRFSIKSAPIATSSSTPSTRA